jgi:hypothetical protein
MHSGTGGHVIPPLLLWTIFGSFGPLASSIIAIGLLDPLVSLATKLYAFIYPVLTTKNSGEWADSRSQKNVSLTSKTRSRICRAVERIWHPQISQSWKAMISHKISFRTLFARYASFCSYINWPISDVYCDVRTSTNSPITCRG